jgi:threonine dehydratase
VEGSPDMDLAELRKAEQVVRRFFPPTPTLFARRLSGRLGVSLHLKLDCFTPIRAFKLRGALNKIQALQDAGVSGGVVTASAGNHGLAVARAARLFGRPAAVYVPETANPQKVEAIEAEGAAVTRHGVDYFEAYERSVAFALAEGWTHIHAYDDPHIIAGQGTMGLEVEECDTFLCGIGGGGLIAGVAFALKQRFPGIRVVGVQPEGAASMALSLEAGQVRSIDRVETIADGLASRRPGDLTFELVRRYVDRVVTVRDDDLIAAMRLLLREERIVAEPAGAAGLAALMRYPDLAAGRVTAAISGANISDEVLARVMEP